MKKIPLLQGHFAFVDDEDYEALSHHAWVYFKVSNHDLAYALRKEKINGKWTTILMHRQIMKTPKGMQTDHIDGNGLNIGVTQLIRNSVKLNCESSKVQRV